MKICSSTNLRKIILWTFQLLLLFKSVLHYVCFDGSINTNRNTFCDVCALRCDLSVWDSFYFRAKHDAFLLSRKTNGSRQQSNHKRTTIKFHNFHTFLLMFSFSLFSLIILWNVLIVLVATFHDFPSSHLLCLSQEKTNISCYKYTFQVNNKTPLGVIVIALIGIFTGLFLLLLFIFLRVMQP